MRWYCAAALFAVGARLAVLPWFPEPLPRYHDEFAYLVGADTFASGRLANPAPVNWQHFEAPHINVRPVYQMKYPPGQGLVLALGQALTGHPWHGVLLSGAMMAAALCWMLRVWFSPPWALAGSMLAVLQVGWLGYWMNSYWGGFLACAGGALVLGSAARGKLVPAVAGALILAVSRPFEGALVCLVALVWAHFRAPRWSGAGLAAALGICGALLMAGYNHRLTGSPATMPHQVHQQEYGASPVLWILPPVKKPEYRHDTIRRLWEWDLEFYKNSRENPLYPVGSLATVALPYLLGWALVPPLLYGAWLNRGIAAVVGIFLVGVCLERWLLPHYLAPITGGLFVLITTGLRAMPRIPAALLCLAAVGSVAAKGRAQFLAAYHEKFAHDRVRIESQLLGEPGKDLVLVRYGPKHSIHNEWVYNRADLGQSPIIWARELDPASNRRLAAEFPGRTLWLLEASAPGGAVLSKMVLPDIDHLGAVGVKPELDLRDLPER